MGGEQRPGSQQPGSYLEACGVANVGAVQPSSGQEEHAAHAGAAVGPGRLPLSACNQGGRHSSMDEVRQSLGSARLGSGHPHCRDGRSLPLRTPVQGLCAINRQQCQPGLRSNTVLTTTLYTCGSTAHGAGSGLTPSQGAKVLFTGATDTCAVPHAGQEDP